jgi:hypothetical protein
MEAVADISATLQQWQRTGWLMQYIHTYNLVRCLAFFSQVAAGGTIGREETSVTNTSSSAQLITAAMSPNWGPDKDIGRIGSKSSSLNVTQ